MKSCVRVAVAMVMVLGLAACGSKSGNVRDGAGGSTTGSGSTYGSSTAGTGSTTAFAGHPLDDPQSPLADKVIYFEFDRYEVQAQFRETVAAHGAYLAANPSARVRLEGHCDERGTREYNLGLGERRASAVQELLVAAGARVSQVESVSYGEEQPVQNCHAERCWSLNRRAVITYTVR